MKSWFSNSDLSKSFYHNAARQTTGNKKVHRNSIEITVGFMAESKGFFRRTPVCLRVASLLDHVGKNSPPDCFLPQTSLLPPCSNPKQKREAMPKHHFSFWRRVRDSNPRYITYTAFRVLWVNGSLVIFEGCLGKFCIRRNA